MKMSQLISSELSEAAFKLGSDLAAPDQNTPRAVDLLNLNLATIGCEPSADAQIIRGSWQTVAFKISSPPFVRAIRCATSSIIWREESLADTLPPIGSSPVERPDGNSTGAVWVPEETVNLEKALKDSTEGAVWIDPEAAKHRANISETNAALLKAVIGGLASNGYKPSDSKRAMHLEFDEVLDSLWLRGSYHCFSESKVVAAIMRKSGIRMASDTLQAAKRFKSFGKEYGYGLALQRLLPEAVLAELD